MRWEPRRQLLRSNCLASHELAGIAVYGRSLGNIHTSDVRECKSSLKTPSQLESGSDWNTHCTNANAWYRGVYE